MDKEETKSRNISVIFLLAGFGKRISEYTKDPKCLLKINDKTLIERNLTYLKDLKIKNITMVLGYKKELIKKEIKSKKKYFNINFVNNNNFKKFGNSYSLFKGLKKTKGNCLIFDGDVIYSKKILRNFITKGYNSSFLVGKTSIKNIECAKVLVDKKGYVRKTIDKRLIKKSELKKHKFVGEAIGVIKVTNNVKNKMIKHMKDFFKYKKNLSLNWEHFMNEFLTNNHVRYNMTLNSQWIEIDTKEDYVRAISIFKKND